MLRGLVPLPTDALAGGYYPWLGQNWGFVVGIPYKNAALTDVFSQLYPWKVLAMDLIRHGSLPLWNPFSFCGYPLLANWQSAPFYPLNIFMLIFGNSHGYGFMVFLQPILTASFMYLFLRQIKLSKIASMAGAIISAYSGFVMVYLEYATTGQIMIWLPLILYLFEKYFEKRNIRYLVLASLSFFPVLTAGFFQPAFYVTLIAALYWVFRTLAHQGEIAKIKTIILGGVFIIVGVATASIQLIPTAELLSLSIRNLDNNIVEYHYGLLPLRHFITFLAPDFFGNPATGNYWGAIQYQEAVGYFSVIALSIVIPILISKRRDWRLNLFSGLFVGSIVLAFDNPISILVYQLKIPLISTGYASRWLLITAFSAAYLAAVALEKIERKKLIYSFFAMAGVLVITYGLIWKNILPIDSVHSLIALRNLLLPIALTGAAFAASVVFKNKKILSSLLLILLAFDLGRFTIKFTPFSKPEYVERQLPVFQYIKNNSVSERVISEGGYILPANTWMYPEIYSPDGYDPLLYKDYAVFFKALNMGRVKNDNQDLNLDKNGFTRYLNLSNSDSPLIDLVGVKYLLAVKYDEYGKIRSWGKINEAKVDLEKYKEVFVDGETVVLQNGSVLPRVMLYYNAESEMDSTKAVEKLAKEFDFKNKILLNKENLNVYPKGQDDFVKINSYSANKINLTANTQNGAYLLLTDTYYPGWKVFINGKEEKIMRADGIFRAVELPSGNSDITMVYKPTSFKIGAIISIISLAGLAVILCKKSSKKE